MKVERHPDGSDGSGRHDPSLHTSLTLGDYYTKIGNKKYLKAVNKIVKQKDNDRAVQQIVEGIAVGCFQRTHRGRFETFCCALSNVRYNQHVSQTV